MRKDRLLAFSDGVFAIIITIMVLELKVPHEATLHALKPLVPVFLAYVLSFVYVGIYWNNHHHLLHAGEHLNGGVMWANLGLLFSLSLFPFSTAWFGENAGDTWPSALYGVVLLAAAIAYFVLQRTLVKANGGPSGALAQALGSDWKGRLSPVLYALGIAVAFLVPWVSPVIYAGVAVLWLVPDRRLTRVRSHDHKTA